MAVVASWSDRVEAMRRRPTGVRFRELESLVLRIGYRLDRQTASHRIYRCEGLPTINLQKGRGGEAKPYPVRQVLAIIEEHGIEV